MTEIIEKVNAKLLLTMTSEQVEEVDRCLYIVLHDYEVTKKETAIVKYTGDIDQQLIKRFLTAKAVQGCTTRTIGYYQRTLQWIKGQIEKPLHQLTTEDVLYYLAVRKVQDKVSASTQDNELRVLRSFYGYLSDNELVERDPTRKIPKIRGVKKVKTTFTETELELMRNACNTRKGMNYKHIAILEVLISTGCRATELATMQLEHLQGDKIKIIGKGNKERWVYLNARAVMALTNWLNVRTFHSPYIFTGENIATGEETDHLGRESVNQIVKNIAKRAGVENCHAHKFRRTAATMALRRGMPIELVSKMLGHEQIATTQIYLQISDDELESAHKKYC